MKVLVTGGLGYIGSHTVVELSNKGYECLIVDKLTDSGLDVLGRMQKISEYPIGLMNVDLLDEEKLADVFKRTKIHAVIHTNELKSVDASLENPLADHEAIVTSTKNLLGEMKRADVKRIVFSSSATRADSANIGWNPYDRTNLLVEEMLQELLDLDSKWRIALLKYSTVVGAHSSGMIGEDPYGVPSNLLGLISRVASGKKEFLELNEDDRAKDYIHVMDLAMGHVDALKYLVRNSGSHLFNVGTGIGFTALDLVRSFEEVNGVKVPYRIVDEPIDESGVGILNSTKAQLELGWQAMHGLHEICKDAWRWERESKKLLMR